MAKHVSPGTGRATREAGVGGRAQLLPPVSLLESELGSLCVRVYPVWGQ